MTVADGCSTHFIRMTSMGYWPCGHYVGLKRDQSKSSLFEIGLDQLNKFWTGLKFIHVADEILNKFD